MTFSALQNKITNLAIFFKILIAEKIPLWLLRHVFHAFVVKGNLIACLISATMQNWWPQQHLAEESTDSVMGSTSCFHKDWCLNTTCDDLLCHNWRFVILSSVDTTKMAITAEWIFLFLSKFFADQICFMDTTSYPADFFSIFSNNIIADVKIDVVV